MIICLTGPFGVGKTTVADSLARALPGALVFDPEQLDFVLRDAPPPGVAIEDFQDLVVWRTLAREAVAGPHRELLDAT